MFARWDFRGKSGRKIPRRCKAFTSFGRHEILRASACGNRPGSWYVVCEADFAQSSKAGVDVKASISRLRRVSGWRHLLPMLMLVAFALQSYVTQTHIHFAGHVVTGGFTFPDDGAKIGKALGASQNQDDHDKYPPGDDPANCPICQEILYAGHYVAPAAVAALLPILAVRTITRVDIELPYVFSLSHIWQVRGPPRT
jgi:hypothetical protein